MEYHCEVWQYRKQSSFRLRDSCVAGDRREIKSSRGLSAAGDRGGLVSALGFFEEGNRCVREIETDLVFVKRVF